MEENEKSENIVSLICKLFGSLESTDLVGRQLGKMRLVYELNQANIHFARRLDDAKKKPQVDILDTDRLSGMLDSCKANARNVLLTDGNNDTIHVVDYLLPAMEKYKTEHLPANFSLNLRSAIDVIALHVSFTDGVLDTAINEGVERLMSLLDSIGVALKRDNWSEEDYRLFAESVIRGFNVLVIGADPDIRLLREQMKHEDDITEDFLMDILDSKLVEFLRSDFADMEWCSYSKSALTRKCGDMKDIVKDFDDKELLMRRMNVFASVLENDGRKFIVTPTAKLGEYLYRHREYYRERRKELFDYYKFAYVIDKDLRNLKIKEDNIELVKLADDADVIDEEVAANSGISHNAELFLRLLRKMNARQFSGKTWLLVFSIAMNHPKFGYDGTLKDFHEKVIQGIAECDITYIGVNNSLKNELPGGAEDRKETKKRLLTKNSEWKDDEFVRKMLYQDRKAKSFLCSIEEYFRERCNEVVAS